MENLRDKWALLNSIRRSAWWREPFLHFIVLGALIFAAYAAFGARSGNGGRRIEVTAFDMARIRALAVRQWGRDPEPAVMHDLIDRYVREEVLYREALAAGMDRDDVIIRRRLAQKMEFLAQEGVSAPSDDDTQAYFATHAARYRVPPRVSFEQIAINRDMHGVVAEDRVRAMLDALNHGRTVGGDVSLLPPAASARSMDEIARDFGDSFARSAFELPVGSWNGPVESQYGVHLVRVTARTEVGGAEYQAVQAQVRTDLMNQRIEQAREAAYQKLRARYVIAVSTDGAVARAWQQAQR